jgi:hypothetical protein
MRKGRLIAILLLFFFTSAKALTLIRLMVKSVFFFPSAVAPEAVERA